MIEVRDVAEVRAAEAELMAALPEGTLMQRAAFALAVACAALLEGVRDHVVGARVVLLVGSGDNGGDALWCGAGLAGRGCRVDAITLSDQVHGPGARALRRSGGRVLSWADDPVSARSSVDRADLVIDGILGIGGRGGLRPDAATLVDLAAQSGALVVSVDVPSGVDADSGRVEGSAVVADVTVTFGAVKPGLVVAPGCLHAGTVRLVDIGLAFERESQVRVLDSVDVARWVPEPAADAHKYRRGVVGVAAGSAAYPGAALLATAAARESNVGMVRFLDRQDGSAARVVEAYPDIVVDGASPQAQDRADAWACGPGFAGDRLDALAVRAVLEAPVPVVLDAGALTVLAEDDSLRSMIAGRQAAGLVTVVTPHEGEFARLLPGLLLEGRLAAAVEGARRLEAIVVLKGPGTVIAAPDGSCLVDDQGSAHLGTAGSGDVLTGMVGALLASAWATGMRTPGELLEATAAAVWLHGAAGRLAAVEAPVTAIDVAARVGGAIRVARFGRQAVEAGP